MKKYHGKITYTIDKTHPDIKYIEEWSVYNDIKIILSTPFKMFNRNEKYVK